MVSGIAFTTCSIYTVKGLNHCYSTLIVSSATVKWFQVLLSPTHHHHHVVPSARISLTLSLATSPNHSSLLAGLQGFIPYLHTIAVCMFELVVLLLLGHMRVSIGVHH